MQNVVEVNEDNGDKLKQLQEEARQRIQEQKIFKPSTILDRLKSQTPRSRTVHPGLKLE